MACQNYLDLACEGILLLGSNLFEDNLSQMRKQTIVKVKVKAGAFRYLQTINHCPFKMAGLTYSAPEIQSYLHSPLFDNEAYNSN